MLNAPRIVRTLQLLCIHTHNTPGLCTNGLCMWLTRGQHMKEPRTAEHLHECRRHTACTSFYVQGSAGGVDEQAAGSGVAAEPAAGDAGLGHTVPDSLGSPSLHQHGFTEQCAAAGPLP